MLFEFKEPFALDWVTLIVLGVATILGLLQFNKALSLSSLIYLPQLNIQEKRDLGKTDLKKISLDLIFFLLIALMITQFIVLKSQRTMLFTDWILYLKVLFGLILLLIGQRFVHSLHGYITNTSEYLTQYSINKALYLHWSSLLLFPFLILSIYFPYAKLIFIWICIAIFGLSILLSFFKTIPLTSNLSNHFLYHIIFYLCTVEILPLIILYKTFI